MSWTDERIEKLTKMWEGGATASQIAEELGGVSRNAVIGKAHRLGLKARPSPVKPNEKEAPAAAPAPKPARAESAPAAPRPAPPPARHGPGGPGGLPAAGPGRPAGADPARAAAPPGSGQAEPRDCRQDQPARPQRSHLPLADGASRRARLPLLRREGEPRFPLLRRALRPRLSGTAAARPSPAASAAAVWRPPGKVKPSVRLQA